MSLLKLALRLVFRLVYRVQINGIHHLQEAGERVLVIANHTSFLDGLLLATFLPDRLTFAVNTHIARSLIYKPFLIFADIFPMDPTNPLSAKSLIRYLQTDRKAAIFPEGRLTVTGSLMKIYDGTALIADKSGAAVVPVRIDGAQYTPFSRLRGRVRMRWFPQIRLQVLPCVQLNPPQHLRGRARRKYAGRMLQDVMTDMMFSTSNYRRTLFGSLLDARRIHGGRHVVVEDIERNPLSYNKVIARSLIIGKALNTLADKGQVVGVLLPGTCNTVATLMGLEAYGRVPALLNFTVGAHGMASACESAKVTTIVTSSRFIEVAKLDQTIAQLPQTLKIVYLEDLAKTIGIAQKILGLVTGLLARPWYAITSSVRSEDPAVVLFTSGSEGTPKGVVLSHANLLANREQLAARVDFTSLDIILNALPLFHSFGLTAGTLLPLLSGMRTFFYPSPLHYRIVPEMAYDVNATVMFGTNTFLTGYARFAHPYDFYSVRYVFAGAEKLQEETKRVWANKFGVRIFEGYGATETSPAISTNTPIDNKEGTVGRLLPGIDYFLEDVPGVEEGGRLHVTGPNVMLGYYLHDDPGVLQPATSRCGRGWYDTGDIISIDDEGFLKILGRAKRFAKIGGEMVSLSAVEALAATVWPDAEHAVVSLPDPRKGEQLVLVTSAKHATRGDLSSHAKDQGIGEINVPKTVLKVSSIPVLGTGKTDYDGVGTLVEKELG